MVSDLKIRKAVVIKVFFDIKETKTCQGLNGLAGF
jgi:hypothetical protein